MGAILLAIVACGAAFQAGVSTRSHVGTVLLAVLVALAAWSCLTTTPAGQPDEVDVLPTAFLAIAVGLCASWMGGVVVGRRRA